MGSSSRPNITKSQLASTPGLANVRSNLVSLFTKTKPLDEAVYGYLTCLYNPGKYYPLDDKELEIANKAFNNICESYVKASDADKKLVLASLSKIELQSSLGGGKLPIIRYTEKRIDELKKCFTNSDFQMDHVMKQNKNNGLEIKQNQNKESSSRLSRDVNPETNKNVLGSTASTPTPTPTPSQSSVLEGLARTTKYTLLHDPIGKIFSKVGNLELRNLLSLGPDALSYSNSFLKTYNELSKQTENNKPYEPQSKYEALILIKIELERFKDNAIAEEICKKNLYQYLVKAFELSETKNSIFRSYGSSDVQKAIKNAFKDRLFEKEMEEYFKSDDFRKKSTDSKADNKDSPSLKR